MKKETNRKRPLALVLAFLTLLAVAVPVIASASEESLDASDSQTVSASQTGGSSNLGIWLGLGAVALGGIVSGGIIAIKRKKDDDDDK